MGSKRPIYISVVAKKEGVTTSFHFKKATVAQLSMINHELDILKRDIIERIEQSPKEWEVTEEYES
ncbi:hypothetical protein KAT51_00945 [bacterium]|nr:hypothetical protein [bacterium]